MKEFEVYIDGGFVGHIRAGDLQEAREAAIKFYNIQQDQKVMVCAKPSK